MNVAARLAEQASPDEVLVSDAALSELDAESLKVKKKRRFKVKGVPDDLQAYSSPPCYAGEIAPGYFGEEPKT